MDNLGIKDRHIPSIPMEGFQGVPAGESAGHDSRSPSGCLGTAEKRVCRDGQSLGMKSLGMAFSAFKKITSLLGGNKDSCVNLRVSVQ